MAVVSAASFERLLGSLDEAALTAFVADLWSARGHEVLVDGARVMADDTVIQCVPRRHGRRSRIEVRDDAVDVIVVAGGDPPNNESTNRRGVRVLGPDDVRGMLLYGIDRRTAGAIFEDHFGRPLTGGAPRDGFVGRARSVPIRPLIGVTLLVVVVGLAVASGAGYGSLPGDARTVDVPPMTVPTSTPVAGTAAPFEPPAAGGALFRFPPGIGPSGVTDAGELAAAHREATSPAQWHLLLVYAGTTDLLNPDRQWVGSHQTVDRRSDSRYLYRVTGLERTGVDEFETVIYDDFGDDSYNYRRIAGTHAPRFQRSLIPRAGSHGVFTAVSAVYVERYLATTESRVELIQSGGNQRFRVVATGRPTALPESVQNYTAIAIVDRWGMVTRLTVDYDRPARVDAFTPVATPPEQLYPNLEPTRSPAVGHFRMVFRDVEAVPLESPSWYPAARNETNGTAVGPWPNDPGV